MSTPRRTTAESPSLPAVLPPILDASISQRDLAPTLDYAWSGQTRNNVLDVAANTCAHVVLHVVCFTPGTYCLSDYSVSWTYPGLGNLTGACAGPAVSVSVLQQAM